MNAWILWFTELRKENLEQVGGKNASLGEMIHHLTSLGVRVPQGFAVSVKAYRDFIRHNQLEEKISELLKKIDPNNLETLSSIAKTIRNAILEGEFPKDMAEAIVQAYETLAKQYSKQADFSVAVRSSATAEDLPEASFAGQQESFLNVLGAFNVLNKVKQVYASLYGDRAISYRLHQGFPHENVGIAVGVQQMVRSDLGVSGVMFTLDTESGFKDVVLINASYGLGELLVQGAVNPDEFYIYKNALKEGKSAVIRKTLGSKQYKMIYAEKAPSDNKNILDTLVNKITLDKKDIIQLDVPEEDQHRFSLNETDLQYLAKQALLIEEHYGCPMDIEWAKDGIDQNIYILQARPETVAHGRGKQNMALERYCLGAKGSVLAQGRSVGQKIGRGRARILKSHREMDQLQKGEVLVTDMTDPDWEPVMKRAAAIVTNRGGRTCHAAIIARELGIPAVVGTGNATEQIKNGEEITVSCAEGDTGYIYQGGLNFDIKRFDLETLPELPFKIMMTIGNPERAFDFQRLPNAGVGLARLEFIINQTIGIHPRACLEFDALDEALKKTILEKTRGYKNPQDFYVNKLAEGIATLAAAFNPKPVIVRLSDFKSNEYANLLGGKAFEPKEENPMLGFRGASRYLSQEFKKCFALECQAVKMVREALGLENVEIMIPFVRTPKEAKAVIDILAENGLKRGQDNLRIIMMCEIPANALLAEEFLNYFDGFSIGSNDLTQLTLGLDRDSGLVAHHFDERDDAVRALLLKAIEACKKAKKTIGICGQGPSDYPDFARWLMERGIDSVSLNPDSVLSTWMDLA